MRMSHYLFASALCVAAGAAQAMPLTGSAAMREAAGATNLVEQTAVFVYEGRPFCFYFDGWQGPGWYRCGFAWRRGLGWGGVYGWQGWNYGPAERRFGHVGHGERYGEGTHRDRGVRERGFSDRGTVRQGGNITTRGSRFQGQTTGSGVGGPNGGARTSAPRSGASVTGGGASRGGGSSMGGGSGGGGGGGAAGR
jgi:hypothetical protein